MNILQSMKPLKDIINLIEYLEILHSIKDRYMIMITVQGDWFKAINFDITMKLLKLGVKANFNELTESRSYIVVLNNGALIYEMVGIDGEMLYYNDNCTGTKIEIISKAKAVKLPDTNYFKAGIIINGDQVTSYKEGLSIAVYDVFTNMVIDAVTFDTSSSRFLIFRADVYCKELLNKISELHVGFGYTIAQWLYDHDFYIINIIIEPQFMELVRSVVLPIKMNEKIIVNNYFVYSNEPLVIKYEYDKYLIKEKYHPINLSKIKPNETVIYISPYNNENVKKTIEKKGGVFFHLVELLNNAFMYINSEEIILKLVVENPGILAASYTTPNPPKQNKLDEKNSIIPTLHNNIDALKNGGRSSEQIISPYIREDKKYSDQDWLEMICYPNPEAYNDENGYRRFKDKIGKYVNIVNGHRVTSFNPETYDNIIYIFGGCNAFGIYTSDEQTFSSILQKKINEMFNGKKYRVENYSHFLLGHYIDIARVICSVKPKAGDILLYPSNFNKISRFPNCNIKKTEPPDYYGYLWHDNGHFTANMHRFIGEKLYDFLIENDFLKNQPSSFIYKTCQIPLCGLQRNTVVMNLPSEYKFKLEEYKAKLRNIREQKIGKIGAIVMNCNPFTFGHRYLIEYAASKVKFLFIFVVEEDKSIFPFQDRFELIKAGTKDLKNVMVMPSGEFIISSLTFSEYFQKSSIQDRTIDPSNDIKLFAIEIAPILSITIRFAGEEPLDKVTQQYNDAMRRILPQYGIEFEVIKRKESDGAVISASRVRSLLSENNYKAISKIVPKTTMKYLKKKHSI